MSEEQVAVAVDKPVKAGPSKGAQAAGLARRLGLERAIQVVATAREYGEKRKNENVTFTVDEVEDLLALSRARITVDELAAAVKTRVSEILG